jgi:UDP-2-acetamido-3-amino-2,3-dideoxy-glucuronate N-acetyltransferase
MSTYFAHESAVIDPGAEIGEGSKVWHFCHVMSNARIGRDCILGQNVFVADGVRIGDRVKVQNNVSIYKGVMIEDEVFLGPSMVFTNVINPRSGVERKDEFNETNVRRGVTIGANATIVCGIELGEYCFIGAGAVVTRTVLPFQLIVGNPGKPIGWMSRAGHRLLFDDSGVATCPGSGDEFKLLDGQVFHRL